MHKKVYSGISRIPRGAAGEDITEGCLVLEGGAFRGLYTQGFLDAMMTENLNLRCVIGVSAGALSGMNYVSGQIGRSAFVNLRFRHDPRYVGAEAMRNAHSVIDLGFLFEEQGLFEPFNAKRFNRPEQRFVAVATDCLTGEPAFLEKGKCPDILKGIRASATMPYVSPMVFVDGVPYLDGACSLSIPYQWAIDEGYEKILVIRTRQANFRKKVEVTDTAQKFYHKYPKFANTLQMSSREYNRECREIEELHKAGRLLRLAPSRPVTVSRLEGDMEKLGQLYHLGWNDCMERLQEIRGYLGV